MLLVVDVDGENVSYPGVGAMILSGTGINGKRVQ